MTWHEKYLKVLIINEIMSIANRETRDELTAERDEARLWARKLYAENVALRQELSVMRNDRNEWKEDAERHQMKLLAWEKRAQTIVPDSEIENFGLGEG